MTTLLLALDEKEQLVDLRHELVIAAQDFPRMIQAYFGPIDQPVRFGEEIDDVGRELIALQSHDIDASRSSRVTFHEHERRDVVQDSAESPHESVTADGGVVVNGRPSGHRRMIVEVNVAAQQGPISHNDVVAKLAIMSNVGTRHKEVVATNEGDPVLLFTGSIDRHSLAYDVVIPDDHLSVAALIGYVLGLAADDHVGIDMVVATNGYMPHHGNVVFNPGTGTDAHMRTDHGKRPYLDVVVKFGLGMNGYVFGGVNGHGGWRDSLVLRQSSIDGC